MSTYLEKTEKEFQDLYQSLMSEFKKMGEVAQGKFDKKTSRYIMSKSEASNLVLYMTDTEKISELAYKLKCQYDMLEWERSRLENHKTSNDELG